MSFVFRAPDVGNDWAAYFKAYHEQRAAYEDPESEVFDEGRTTEIIEQGHLIAPAEAPTGVKRMAQKLQEADWRVFVVRSMTYTSGGFYGPTAQKAGEPKPEVTHYHYNVIAGNRGARARMYYLGTEEGKATFQDAVLLDGKELKAVDRAGGANAWLAERSRDNDNAEDDGSVGSGAGSEADDAP